MSLIRTETKELAVHICRKRHDRFVPASCVPRSLHRVVSLYCLGINEKNSDEGYPEVGWTSLLNTIFARNDFLQDYYIF